MRCREGVKAVTALTTIRSEDGNEAGGILLGQVHDGVAEIRVAGGPGLATVRQHAFFLCDVGHAQRIARDGFALDGSIWVGEWHTLGIPTSPPSPERT